MMLYYRSAQLAMQGALLLALEPEGKPRRVRDIAAALGAPATYLAKVMQLLTHAGLLRAKRGPKGGLQLARSPREISLWDVLEAVEPRSAFDRCLLGLGQCSVSNPCTLHGSWCPIRNQMFDMLRTRTLQEFAVQIKEKGVLRPS